MEGEKITDTTQNNSFENVRRKEQEKESHHSARNEFHRYYPSSKRAWNEATDNTNSHAEARDLPTNNQKRTTISSVSAEQTRPLIQPEQSKKIEYSSSLLNTFDSPPLLSPTIDTLGDEFIGNAYKESKNAIESYKDAAKSSLYKAISLFKTVHTSYSSCQQELLSQKEILSDIYNQQNTLQYQITQKKQAELMTTHNQSDALYSQTIEQLQQSLEVLATLESAASQTHQKFNKRSSDYFKILTHQTQQISQLLKSHSDLTQLIPDDVKQTLLSPTFQDFFLPETFLQKPKSLIPLNTDTNLSGEQSSSGSNPITIESLAISQHKTHKNNDLYTKEYYQQQELQRQSKTRQLERPFWNTDQALTFVKEYIENRKNSSVDLPQQLANYISHNGFTEIDYQSFREIPMTEYTGFGRNTMATRGEFLAKLREADSHYSLKLQKEQPTHSFHDSKISISLQRESKEILEKPHWTDQQRRIFIRLYLENRKNSSVDLPQQLADYITHNGLSDADYSAFREVPTQAFKCVNRYGVRDEFLLKLKEVAHNHSSLPQSNLLASTSDNDSGSFENNPQVLEQDLQTVNELPNLESTGLDNPFQESHDLDNDGGSSNLQDTNISTNQQVSTDSITSTSIPTDTVFQIPEAISTASERKRILDQLNRFRKIKDREDIESLLSKIKAAASKRKTELTRHNIVDNREEAIEVEKIQKLLRLLDPVRGQRELNNIYFSASEPDPSRRKAFNDFLDPMREDMITPKITGGTQCANTLIDAIRNLKNQVNLQDQVSVPSPQQVEDS